MCSCSFFGSGHSVQDIRNELENVISELIVKENVEKFYSTYSNIFDEIVVETLHEMKIKYPNITYYVVICGDSERKLRKTNYIMLCDKTYRDLLFSCRLWMLRNSSYTVFYNPRKTPMVSKFSYYANMKNKRIISI